MSARWACINSLRVNYLSTLQQTYAIRRQVMRGIRSDIVNKAAVSILADPIAANEHRVPAHGEYGDVTSSAARLHSFDMGLSRKKSCRGQKAKLRSADAFKCSTRTLSIPFPDERRGNVRPYHDLACVQELRCCPLRF